MPAIGDPAVTDDISERLLIQWRVWIPLPDLQTASSEIGEDGVIDDVPLASASEFQTVVADVFEPAIFESAVVHTAREHGGGDAVRRLLESACRFRPQRRGLWQAPFGV